MGWIRHNCLRGRRKAIASGVVAPLGGSPSWPVRFTRFESVRSDTVEIVIGDVVVRAGGDVDPLTWLALRLQRIANGWPIAQIEKLMPWNYKA